MKAAPQVRHTPGPWWPGTFFTDGVFAYGAGDEVKIATCERRSVISDGEETEANARLIAAAPLMLEALEMALPYLEDPDADAIPFAVPASLVARDVRAAIATATGGAS